MNSFSATGMIFNSPGFSDISIVGEVQCIDIPVQDDSIVESIIVKSFSLSVDNGNDRVGVNESTVIRIVDNDGEFLISLDLCSV